MMREEKTRMDEIRKPRTTETGSESINDMKRNRHERMLGIAIIILLVIFGIGIIYFAEPVGFKSSSVETEIGSEALGSSAVYIRMDPYAGRNSIYTDTEMEVEFFDESGNLLTTNADGELEVNLGQTIFATWEIPYSIDDMVSPLKNVYYGHLSAGNAAVVPFAAKSESMHERFIWRQTFRALDDVEIYVSETQITEGYYQFTIDILEYQKDVDGRIYNYELEEALKREEENLRQYVMPVVEPSVDIDPAPGELEDF